MEQIFGKSTEIDREGKKEFTFGKVIGLVTDSFLDEKTKRQKVSMLLCDADSKLLLWNGRPVEIIEPTPKIVWKRKNLIFRVFSLVEVNYLQEILSLAKRFPCQIWSRLSFLIWTRK